MSIGLIMFGKAVLLAIIAALSERYKAWKASRRRDGIPLSFDGRTYYDPVIRWEAMARKAWIVTLWSVAFLCIAAVSILFSDLLTG